MNLYPLTYEDPVFRPPGEAQSLLVQVTIGCSHNRCSFCGMYRTKKFRIRGEEEIADDLERAAFYFNKRKEVIRKIFFCDGDALAAPSNLLLTVAKIAKKFFPGLRRIGIYATAQNVLNKTEEELEALYHENLSIAYLGLESGSDDVLQFVGKGNSAEEAIEAGQRLRLKNWQTSLIVMLGLGGQALSSAHREATAKVVSAISPRFLSFLTTVAVPETWYDKQVHEGTIRPLSSRELLQEMHYLIEHIRCPEKVIFRANHVSNQFPLEGVLPRDQVKLLLVLERWITECPLDLYPQTNPFFL